jgi:hypothetical protein
MPETEAAQLGFEVLLFPYLLHHPSIAFAADGHRAPGLKAMADLLLPSPRHLAVTREADNPAPNATRKKAIQ